MSLPQPPGPHQVTKERKVLVLRSSTRKEPTAYALIWGLGASPGGLTKALVLPRDLCFCPHGPAADRLTDAEAAASSQVPGAEG